MPTLHTDLSLTYLSTNDNKRGAPLLLLLHGVGSNERDLLRLESYFSDSRIVSVRAPLTLALGRFAWFHVNFTPAPVHDAAEAETSRQTLITFIDELTMRYGVTHEEVYLLGFSQGAILISSVALTYREYSVGHELSEANLLDVGAWLEQRVHASTSAVKGLQWQPSGTPTSKSEI